MTSLKTRYIETIKFEIKVLIDIKIKYFNIFKNLILIQLNNLIYIFKVINHNYKKTITAIYYKILGISYLYNL